MSLHQLLQILQYNLDSRQCNSRNGKSVAYIHNQTAAKPVKDMTDFVFEVLSRRDRIQIQTWGQRLFSYGMFTKDREDEGWYGAEPSLSPYG